MADSADRLALTSTRHYGGLLPFRNLSRPRQSAALRITRAERPRRLSGTPAFRRATGTVGVWSSGQPMRGHTVDSPWRGPPLHVAARRPLSRDADADNDPAARCPTRQEYKAMCDARDPKRALDAFWLGLAEGRKPLAA